MNLWTKLQKIQEAFSTKTFTREAIVSLVGFFGWTVSDPAWLFATDENGDEYLFLPLHLSVVAQVVHLPVTLPYQVYAEIDDNTYGNLNGYRVYR